MEATIEARIEARIFPGGAYCRRPYMNYMNSEKNINQFFILLFGLTCISSNKDTTFSDVGFNSLTSFVGPTLSLRRKLATHFNVQLLGCASSYVLNLHRLRGGFQLDSASIDLDDTDSIQDSCFFDLSSIAVSYTHLTLPTKRIV